MKGYAYCVVPLCKNTTKSTPNKMFIRVPDDPIRRSKWYKLMKRKHPLSSKSRAYCCEDHFNVEEDIENHMRYKLTNGNVNLKIKPNAVPHKFDCQKRICKPERDTHKKRRQRELVKQAEEYFVDVRSDLKEPIVEMEPESERQGETTPLKFVDKATQVDIKKMYRSKSTSTTSVTKEDSKTHIDSACSPIKHNTKKDCSVSQIVKESEPESDESHTSDSDFIPSAYNSSDPDYNDEVDSRHNLHKHMCTGIIETIIHHPKKYTGVTKKMTYIFELFVSEGNLKKTDIFITLSKIRLDLSYSILGTLFGLSTSSICRVFQKTVPKLVCICKQMIVWPKSDEIWRHLPLSFRARYTKVQSIIDCLEIQIEKPTNATNQTLTWSQYKRCNTLKYLISCTPDGVINFISHGYGGRTSDTVIFEDCGYIELLKPGMWVMADRGFKNVSHILQKKGVHLVRPPSVSGSTKPSKDDIKVSKQIAALRIHIERVISRIREFKMLTMHSTVDNHLLQNVDDIVTIACGLVNIQDNIIKM